MRASGFLRPALSTTAAHRVFPRRSGVRAIGSSHARPRRPALGPRPTEEATITSADQARQLVLRRGVRRRGRGPRRRPGPRRGGRRRRRSAPAAAPRCGSSPRCSTPARSSRSAPAPASPGCGCCAACAPTASSPPSTSRPSTSGWPSRRSPRPASPPSGPAPSPAPRSTCSPGSPTATTTWSSATATRREYAAYLNEALRLLRPGGVVAFDNALWHDRVADPAQRDEETVAIRELGREVAERRRPGAGAAARSATGCWPRRRSGRPEAGDVTPSRAQYAGGGLEAVPALGDGDDLALLDQDRGAADDLRAGRLGGAWREASPGTPRAPRRSRRRSSPRTTRRAGIRQVLNRSPVHAGEAGVRGVRDVRRELAPRRRRGRRRATSGR